jgi:flagellar motor switch/type III secretory pathway protein FliN
MNQFSSVYPLRFVDSLRVTDLQKIAREVLHTWCNQWVAQTVPWGDLDVSCTITATISAGQSGMVYPTRLGLCYYRFFPESGTPLLNTLLGLPFQSCSPIDELVIATAQHAGECLLHKLLQSLAQNTSIDIQQPSAFDGAIECQFGFYHFRIGEWECWVPAAFLGPNPRASKPPKPMPISAVLPAIQLSVEVCLPAVTMGMTDLLSLQPGTVIRTDHLLADGVELACSGRVLARGRLSRQANIQSITLTK